MLFEEKSGERCRRASEIGQTNRRRREAAEETRKRVSSCIFFLATQYSNITDYFLIIFKILGGPWELRSPTHVQTPQALKTR